MRDKDKKYSEEALKITLKKVAVQAKTLKGCNITAVGVNPRTIDVETAEP